MKILSMMCLFLVSTSASALPEQGCDFWKEKASLFMNWRQQGLPISEAVNETAGNISRGLLLRAYGEPQEKSLETKYETIEAFSQKIYEECLSQDNPTP